MGFQNKTGSVTVTAKMTDLGKRNLLTAPERFQITKFAALDDEVDYSLWNPTAANGDADYGKAIEGLPTLEPVASNVFQAKYALIKDMDRTTQRMPIFTLNPTSVNLQYIDSMTQVHVLIQNVDEPTVRVILLDNTKADITAPGATMIDVNPLVVQNFIGQSGFTYAKAFECPTNSTIEVTAKRNENNFNVETKMIIIGTSTNARAEVPITIQPNTTIDT